MSLVLGILGLVWLVGVGPLAALYFGYQAKRRIEASQGRISGRGMAVAGIVLGWLGVAAACALVFFVLRPG